MSIVVKFGGTSLASASQIKKAVNIIKADERRRFVVLSAPGKTNKKDIKITDLLLSCYELSHLGADIEKPFLKIREKFEAIVSELEIEFSLNNELEDIKKSIVNGADRDYAASRGEYLNSRIIAKYLGFEFIDPKEYITIDSSGTISSESYKKLKNALLDETKKYVIPGFYGSDGKGRIKTFSRGGSDITGSIVARAISADLYENWTDVSGFLMANPTIVSNPKVIREITYGELRELAYMGAEVLHDEAIFPIRELGIPINIKNTNRPQDPGTMILKERKDNDELIITGIAGRKDFTMISIEKHLMNKEKGFGRKLLSIIESYGISYEHTPTGIDTMSIVFRDTELDGNLEKLCLDIKNILKVDKLEVEHNIALIATVGCGMAFRKGVAAKLFSAIYEASVNVRIIDQGSSEINIIIGVKSDDFEKAINAIYSAFVN